MKDLTILKVKDAITDSEIFRDLDPRLPMPPFRMLINAPSGSGKSNMIQNLLFNDNFYKDKFSLTVYVSPTVYDDRTAQWMHKMDSDKLVLTDRVEELDTIIENLIARQHEDEHKQDHILLILDDCIGLIKRGSKINTFIMRCRHSRISVAMVTQMYRAVDPKIRENSSCYIFYKNANDTEVRKIMDEIGGRFENFKAYYDYATSKPYHFLYIDGYKLYRDFDMLLYDKVTGFRADLSGDS